MKKGSSKNWLRVRSASLRSTHSLAYLPDMSRSLRAVRLASLAARPIFRAALKILPAILFIGIIAQPMSLSAKESAVSLFAKANNAYRAKHYDEAWRLYAQLEQRGVADAQLFYNMGNTALRQDHKGLALAYYRRSQALSPRDADTAANIAHIKGLLKDKEEIPDAVKAKRALAFATTICSTNEILAGLLVLNALLWGLGLLRRYYNREALNWVLIALLASICIFGGSAAFAYIAKPKGHGIVLEPEIAVRSKEGQATLFYLHEGAEVELLQRSADGCKIALLDEKSGWVPCSALCVWE